MQELPFPQSRSLWDVDDIAHSITAGAIHDVLGEAERAELAALADIPSKVAVALTDPKPLDISMPVLAAVLAAQYHKVFCALDLPSRLAVYEPCVGASCPVILATAAQSRQFGSDLAVNLNRKLRSELQPKIAHLHMPIRIIEDHAQRVFDHVKPARFHVACFHHAINDILQTAVSDARDMDTTAIDWFPNERTMIEWLAADADAGRLEQFGKPELMKIIADAVRLVRPAGYLIFDHFNWCRFIGVEWFPWDLFYNLIPMTRAWIDESGLPLRRVPLPGVNPQWWLVYQVEHT